MKKIFKILGVAGLAFLLLGCETSKVKGFGIKGKSAKVKTSKAEIVDYQGALFGSEIPEWVILLADGQYSHCIRNECIARSFERHCRKVSVTRCFDTSTLLSVCFAQHDSLTTFQVA